MKLNGELINELQAEIERLKEESRTQRLDYSQTLAALTRDNERLRADQRGWELAMHDSIQRVTERAEAAEAKLAEAQADVERLVGKIKFWEESAIHAGQSLAAERAKTDKLVEALSRIVKHTPRQGFGQAADMRGIASEALATAKASEEKV